MTDKTFFFLPGTAGKQVTAYGTEITHRPVPYIRQIPIPITIPPLLMSSKLTGPPNWKYQSEPLKTSLDAVYFAFSSWFNGSVQVMTSYQLVLDDLEVVLYSNTSNPTTLFMALCSPKGNTQSNQEITTTSFLCFDLPMELYNKYDEFILYPLQEDPKTSRGTVTTVQSTFKIKEHKAEKEFLEMN